MPSLHKSGIMKSIVFNCDTIYLNLDDNTKYHGTKLFIRLYTIRSTIMSIIFSLFSHVNIIVISY